MKKEINENEETNEEYSYNSESNNEEENEDSNSINEFNVNTNDIVMNGKLIYRFQFDQYELEGIWGMNTESPIEKFSCLLIKKKDPVIVKLNINEIINEKNSAKKGSNIIQSDEDYFIKISSSNLHELVIIPYEKIFKGVLEYLSGEYQGYFAYFSKTIEDRFILNYELDNGFVKMNGYGLNNLGEFKLSGFINFYSTKGKNI